jgi:hypothetical protein
MLAWLRALFARTPQRIPPVLVRARSGGVSAQHVEVEAVWRPSGMRRAYRAKNTQGLCMVPWVANAESVHIRVRADGGERELEFSAEDVLERDGQVFELALN